MGTRYVEFVIEGPRNWGLGFIRGYLRGKGHGGRILNAEQEDFDCERVREVIRELLNRSKETLHILVPEDLSDVVRSAVPEAAEVGREMKILREQNIKGARFSFSFNIYSKDHAERVMEVFRNLPEGVSLTEGSDFKTLEDPGAEGVELYAPTHHYEQTGRGAVAGDVDGVLKIYRYARSEDLVHQDEAELILEEA